ncbi:protein bicaudal C homolog 1-A-like [Cyprinus carpio]|uniref:Protein bicaudal C homolog 1-A-like n=1 Tax=Cyprinus carpio TaxID=7962 RepID=A0A9Q9X1S4_CYPCA|nr:protein bicaudal C homolog 1-A-like [Cyprinus carpio]
MAASETCSSVPESPEPESCDGPQLDQNQTLQNQNQKKEEEDEDEEDEGSELQEPSDPECVEERFRIDRKKLELMLYAPAEGSGLSGEEFFQKVMRETHTQVKWPSKLKIGAKSKKDPHVKVEGKRANVLEAKRKILELLETKVNKVTLKMDVTHTEHSHVIGKGGGNIKKVMEDTSCHIHFPDSNRNNNAGEKSNQVSIAGPVQGVESARRQIRVSDSLTLIPLVLTFDLPVTLVGGVVCDTGSPVIQHVAQAFGVSVSFRTQPKLYCSTCSVRGTQGNAAAVKKATCVLMELLLGAEALAGVTGVMVSTQLDVTSQQHLFLLGQNGANFLTVMHQTHTQIILPDLSAPQHTPSLLIQGTADGVCVARQQLMDCLPVCPCFDLKDEGESDPRKIAQMNAPTLVFLSASTPKVKQTARFQRLRDQPTQAERWEGEKGPFPKSHPNNILRESQEVFRGEVRPSKKTVLGLFGGRRGQPNQKGALEGSLKTRCSLRKAGEKTCVCVIAMQQKPVVTEVRTPTDTWSGLGFSKSMPTDAVKELRAVSRRCYRPYHNQQSWSSQSGKERGWNGSDSENWRERRGSLSSSPPPSSSSFTPYSLSASRTTEGYLTGSEGGASRHLIGRSPSPSHADDLIELLAQLGLEKYIDIFQQQEIDYQTFLTLSDEDLKEVGVNTFGARRKMILAITDLSKKRKFPEVSSMKSGYLEGGASGRLPRIMNEDGAAKSNRW